MTLFEKSTMQRIREVGEFMIKLSEIGIKEEKLWRHVLVGQLRSHIEFLERLAEWLESQ